MTVEELKEEAQQSRNAAKQAILNGNSPGGDALATESTIYEIAAELCERLERIAVALEQKSQLEQIGKATADLVSGQPLGGGKLVQEDVAIEALCKGCGQPFSLHGLGQLCKGPWVD